MTTSTNLLEKRSYTPPEVARRWGVKHGKVMTMIRNGELRALNLASHGCARPRYKILAEDLLACEEGRAVCKKPQPACRTRPRLEPVRDYLSELRKPR